MQPAVLALVVVPTDPPYAGRLPQVSSVALLPPLGRPLQSLAPLVLRFFAGR